MEYVESIISMRGNIGMKPPQKGTKLQPPHSPPTDEVLATVLGSVARCTIIRYLYGDFWPEKVKNNRNF